MSIDAAANSLGITEDIDPTKRCRVVATLLTVIALGSISSQIPRTHAFQEIRTIIHLTQHTCAHLSHPNLEKRLDDILERCHRVMRLIQLESTSRETYDLN